MGASPIPSSGRFPRTPVVLSILLHLTFFLVLGISFFKPPRTTVPTGRSSITIDLTNLALFEAKPQPVPRPTPEAIPIAQAVRAAPRQPLHSASTTPQGVQAAQPDYLHNPPPAYPEASRLAHEQGVVLIDVEVTAAGTAAVVGLNRSSGFPHLDQAALRAVREWRFEPARLGGVPIACRVRVPVRFELN